IRTARSRTSGEYFGTVFMTRYPLKIWSLRQTRGDSVKNRPGLGGTTPTEEYVDQKATPDDLRQTDGETSNEKGR
ncbi:MAG TPA: hypothetical protein VE715_18055, partial [Blastocatellia bacterium]|nr:hypothetical protein [Blastocatellia bacterium]